MFRKKINKHCKKILCLNKCFNKYLLKIFLLFMKYNFHHWNPVDPPLIVSHLMCVNCYHDDVILTGASRLNICLLHAVADLPRIYNACHCKLLTFLTQFYFFRQLKIVYWFVFVTCRIIVVMWYHTTFTS